MPGALSAYGILASDIVKDYSRTVLLSLGSKAPIATHTQQLDVLEHRTRREFRDEGWSGKLHFERSVDLRYRGQGFELNVRFSPACRQVPPLTSGFAMATAILTAKLSWLLCVCGRGSSFRIHP